MLSTHTSKSNSMFGTFSDKCSGGSGAALEPGCSRIPIVSKLYFLGMHSMINDGIKIVGIAV